MGSFNVFTFNPVKSFHKKKVSIFKISSHDQSRFVSII
eukprot:UN12380